MFANKVVLVTGGASRIGAATVILFAKEKASVVFVGRNEEKLKIVSEKCDQIGAKTLAIEADLTKDEELKAIIQKTVDTFGKLDVLVNYVDVIRVAGVDEPDMLETFDEIMNANLRSVVCMTSLAINSLKETKGNIVNVSSIASMVKNIKVPKTTAYTISKGGLDRFTTCAAMELASFGIRVNSVNPALIATRNIKKSSGMVSWRLGLGNVDDSLMTALGKMADVDEVADLILYLASDKAISITGANIVIDNGSLLK